MSDTPQEEFDQHLPSRRGNVEIIVKQGERITYVYTSEAPRELMDQSQQLLGDGKARVTVSADMGAKDFGKGVSSMVSVSLSCNQDQQTIANAVYLAGQFARYYVVQQLKEADLEFQKLMAEKQAAQLPQVPTPHFP